MDAITVTEKSELNKAMEQGYKEIIVIGSLANDLKKSKSVGTAGAAIVAILTTALAAIPFTGGLSMAAAAPVAGITGLEVAAIVIAVSVGLSLLFALFKDYEEISFEIGPDGQPKIVFRKKQKP